MVAFPSDDAMRMFHETRVDVMRRADDALPDTPTRQPMSGREAVSGMLNRMHAQVQQLQQLQADSTAARQLISEAATLENKAQKSTTHSGDFLLAGEIASLTRRLSGLLGEYDPVAL